MENGMSYENDKADQYRGLVDMVGDVALRKDFAARLPGFLDDAGVRNFVAFQADEMGKCPREVEKGLVSEYLLLGR